MVALVVGLLIAGAVVDSQTGDIFSADRVWLYITILASAYIVSRGIAKSGTDELDFDDDGPRRNRRAGDGGP